MKKEKGWAHCATSISDDGGGGKGVECEFRFGEGRGRRNFAGPCWGGRERGGAAD